MTFQIDTSVPIPPLTRPSRRVYPFDEMKVGDSFFVSTKDAGERIRKRQTVASAARKWSKEQGEEPPVFTTRQVRNGVRCWRIA